MHIEVLNTGTELLLGTTLNSHGAWVGQQLMGQGLRVARQMTVPDGKPVKQALAEAIERSDVLIVTGGLGPTSDDLTREAAAEAMGLELIEDEHALRVIEEYFARRGRPMADGNRKQALTPCGAEVLPNPNGTAPGVYVPPRLGKGSPCAVFLLPGPPNEFYPMYLAEVPHRLAALGELAEGAGMSVMKFAGIGESDFHDGVDAKLHEIAGLEVGYCARPAELDLRLIGTETARSEGMQLVLEIYGEKCFSTLDESLESVVVHQLAEQGLKLALAESCTGGLIASRVTDVPGASEVFTHGFVTYANEAKRDVLGVPQSFLDDYGAVSEQVARSMAEGALKVSGADVALSVTGIAGPGGGTEEKPVGTVWFGLARKGAETLTFKSFQPRGRDTFKAIVSQLALDAIRVETKL